MPQTADEPDAVAVRTWCALALDALGREREAIDAINVYPVADGDTGTNLYLTVESAAAAVEAVFAAHETGTSVPSAADAVRAMAHGALIGARGNSGTILAQLLRGMAGVLAEGTGGDRMRLALDRAAAWARDAVAHPVEGTVLTVADRAAAAAGRAAPGADTAEVARAAYEGARTALDATPGQLPALARAGVVDAGGRGLVTLLGALVQAVSGRAPERPYEAVPFVPPPAGDAECPAADGDGESGPAFEVIYLLEAGDEAVERLRTRLDALGDSLVVVGGDGLWNVHVHVDDAGAAVEAGVEAGRPYRIRITHFAADRTHARPEPARRAVVAVVPGEGLAALCREAGATTVLARPGEPPASGELVDAIRRAHAREVVLLPNDADLRHTAAAAAEQARAQGVRVAVVPTRAAVQGIAALAVHEPDRSFDEDVVAMTAAAGATRYAELAVAERQSWTSAGICQAGDILGLIDGDVAVIGQDVPATARKVLDRMLAAGGELVTLVLGENTPPLLADSLEQHVREAHLAVDTTTYEGGHQGAPLLIGVE
ncbi:MULTISPECIES: DAK2 domain-containing protein [unclassified Streptomyces]|uniref:DAK2 domain-containing protein n=1 Tax=unclassified Streptomyces TaxID=2593676 RepID=UPI002E2ABBBC|nr:DAK2 domain-containing protein [Streptomyces sp. NBC_01423]WSX93556.1 DAK2 domain-containing protein [Streptomyces sp. NBC_00891]WSY08033.1 DAK2 domain-containing protein [Streptomyces sp. NBC_00890]WSZ09658.1 DAK2 domain-containing protein [Streptomyces sp. NBC_00869]WSZ22841.1 DAK2 domain-containing protein [Streptomyces sp. NBC_00870]